MGTSNLPDITRLARGKLGGSAFNHCARGPLELIINNQLCDLSQITRGSFPCFKKEGTGTDDYGVLSGDENIKIL